MPVVNSPLGRFRFPDDMPMEAIDAEMSAIHQPEPAPPQGNNFASALRNSFFPEQQAAPDVLPVISAPGLSPQNGDRLRGIIGGQKQLDASEMLRQRANREKALEAAKERSQELKLRKQERDNRILEAQMKLDGDMKVIQGEAEAGKIWETNDGSLVRGYQDPATKKWTTEVLRQGVPKPEKPVRGVVVNGKLVNPYNASVMGNLPAPTMTPQQQIERDIEVRKLLNSARLSPEEDLQAWEMYKATGAVPTFTPNNSRAREFTWRDIMAEKARRRDADQFGVKTEAEIDAEVASDFGLSVDEMRGLMRQRPSGSAAPSPGPLPDYLRRPDTPQPPVQPQASQGFDDEASIPEGAQVQDEQGRILVKKNGKLVPVTGFGQ